MKWIILVGVLCGGCAPRVSLRQVQEYDTAVKIAEQRGIATPDMYDKLGQMMRAYLADPAPDPLVVAQQEMAFGVGMEGTAAMLETLKPAPQPMPMSPGEYRQAVWGR